MKIKELKISDLRNIEIFEGEFSDWNIIGGKNASGKSTVIDAIFFAIVGKTYTSSDPCRLVKHEKDKAIITLTLEGHDREIVITRQFTKATEGNDTGYDYMKVADSEGGKLTQKDLNALLSSFTIDPLYISRLKPKQQIEVIKEIAGIDTSKVEEEAREIYDERTIENRELKRLEGVLSSFSGVKKTEAVDISKLIQEKDEKEAENKQLQDDEAEVSTLRNQKTTIEEEIGRLQAELKTVEKELTMKSKDLEGRTHQDVTELTTQISNAESINAEARKWEGKQKAFKEVQDQTEKAGALDLKYKEKLAERETIIKSSNLPEYIDFDKDEGVLVNGIPFSQLNTAQQIETSIKLASILTPELKVLHIKDGSLLDMDSLEEVKKVVEASGYQILIERVGEEAVDTIVMKEGKRVK